MKKWSASWKKSKKTSKQRKYQKNAPIHLLGRMLASHLSKELRQKTKTRSIRVRKGDKVKVMRGQYKGKHGTVDRVDMKKMKIYITGVEFTKKDGSKAMYPVHPSNTLIEELQADKRRMEER